MRIYLYLQNKGERLLKKISIFLLVCFLLNVGYLSGVVEAKKSKSFSKQKISKVSENKKHIAKRKGKKIRVLATAYYKPERNQRKYATKSFHGDMKLNGGKKTATQKTPKVGMVAVDPRIIPLGTKIYIPELELYATAEDIGGDIKGKRIDIFTGTGPRALKRALDIGRRMVTIIIV